eukprot:evm.model.scf_746.3 EVM.evm.TU.scf_746.3   scf_746:56609-64971(+)
MAEGGVDDGAGLEEISDGGDLESYVTVPLTIVWGLLILAVVMTYFLQRSGFSKVLPPSVGTMVLGAVVGIIIQGAGWSPPPSLHGDGFAAGFLYGLLPPIVFGAGFTLKTRKFFGNFGAITMFAVFGTIVSTIVFGVLTYLLALTRIIGKSALGEKPFVKSMLYGSLISAIDPVATLSVFQDLGAPPLLYNLVFGESVLNDAISIVLYRSFEDFLKPDAPSGMFLRVVGTFLYMSIGSLAVGIIIALFCAYVLKRFNPSDEHSDGSTYEIAMVLMGAYMSYLAAEVLQLSGIVALFFSAIVHAHYSFHNISSESQVAITKMVNVMVFLLETGVFLYLGLQVALLEKKKLDAGLILSGMPLIILSRAANIFLLTKIVNRFRAFRIPFPIQVVQWACGLRGAVSYALATVLNATSKSIFGRDNGVDAIESATLLIVVLSTVLFGGGTGPLMKRLHLQGADDNDVRNLSYNEIVAAGGSSTELDHLSRMNSEEVSGLHRHWESLDNGFLKPIFGGRMRSERDATNMSTSMSLLNSEQIPGRNELEGQQDCAQATTNPGPEVQGG